MTCKSCLGAVPLAVTIITYMVNSRMSALQASQMAAEQYDEFRRMSEAQITDLALELGRGTDIPYWEWFNTLRSVQRWQLSQPNGQPANGGNGAAPVQAGMSQWIWIGLAAAAALLVFRVLGGD